MEELEDAVDKALTTLQKKKNEAEKVIEKFKEEFPGWEVELSFETPNYKVQIGNYKDYYFGMNKLKEIKRVYPSAFLLETKN